METLYLATKDDVQRWIKECLFDFFKDHPIIQSKQEGSVAETFLNRKQVADLLKISMTTLHDWMNRGLPCHKQRGRVYFIQSEVVEYVKRNHRKSFQESEIGDKAKYQSKSDSHASSHL